MPRGRLQKGSFGNIYRSRVTLGSLIFLILLAVLILSSTTRGFVTPPGYRNHDFQKLVTFLETGDGDMTNGEKMNPNYDPKDPATWKGIEWLDGGEKLVKQINFNNKDLYEELDISGCNGLLVIHVQGNKLIRLDAGDCPLLYQINCQENSLKEINLVGCPDLKDLHCNNNCLIVLKLAGYTGLEQLECCNNEPTNLTLQGSNSLKTLKCYDNRLGTLFLSYFTKLQALHCSTNQLTELSIRDCYSCKRCRGYHFKKQPIDGIEYKGLLQLGKYLVLR